MLCFKKNHIIYFTFLSLLVFSFLYIFCFNSVDTFATTYSFNMTNQSTAYYLCRNNSSVQPRCSDVSYFHLSYDIIETPGSLSPSTNGSFQINSQSTNGSKTGLIFPFSYVSGSFSSSDSPRHVDIVLPIDSSVYSSTIVLNQNFSYLSNISVTVSSDSPFGSTPSGSLSITSNGTYDVSSYAEAVVDVPPIPGDYHDDFINLNNTLVLVPAVALVIFLLYLLNRIIIKGGE